MKRIALVLVLTLVMAAASFGAATPRASADSSGCYGSKFHSCQHEPCEPVQVGNVFHLPSLIHLPYCATY